MMVSRLTEAQRDESLRYIVIYLGLSVTPEVDGKIRKSRPSPYVFPFLEGLWKAREKFELGHSSEGALGGYCNEHRCVWLPTTRFKELFKGIVPEKSIERFASIYALGKPLHNAPLMLRKTQTIRKWARHKVLRLDHSEHGSITGIVELIGATVEGEPFRGHVLVGFQQGKKQLWIGIEPATPHDEDHEQPKRPSQEEALAPEEGAVNNLSQFHSCVEAGRVAKTEGADAEVRRATRRTCFERFRRQLCLPLRDADIVELLPSKDLRSEEIPKLFTYIPHTLTFATVPPGQTADAASFAEVDFEGVVQAIADMRERLVVLVEAKAGVGKTTFMYRLAYELACREAGALPLPPVRVVERGRSESPVNWSELITRGVHDLKQLPGDEIRREAVESMMNDGHAVAFVDGLDQLPDGAAKLLVGLPSATKPIKVVASCRQEAHAIADHGWTHVLRLGSPSEDDFSQHVLKEHQDLLEACLGDDDPRNPFMLHIVRVMDCAEGPLPTVAGITELFDSYLAFLFAWAEAKRTGRDVKGMPEDLTREQHLALGVLGLTSLRYWPRGEATEQRIDKEAFDVARDLARQLAMDVNWSSEAVDEVFDYGREHADLVYIAREAFLRKQKTFLFHHQLLQEYLGAVGTIDELERQLDCTADGDRAVTTLACLARLFSDVIVPWRSDGVKPSVPPWVPSHYRIFHLRYFEFVARLLGRTESPLSLEDRARFLSLIPAAIKPRDLNDVQYPLVPMVATALLRLRDEMSEHDTSLIEWAQEPTDRDTNGRRTKLAEVESGAVRDAFVLVCWPEEKQRIEELQPDDAEIAELVDRMRRQEPELGWTVTREDHAVVATTNEGTRWLHVPASEFIAGGWAWMEDMPVRLERTGAFWIAHDPVTFGEFKLFVGKGYNLDDDCWYPFPDWAFVHHEELPLSRFRPVLRDDAPIVWVGWCEAAAYCRWLSLKHSSNRCADRYRLPTGPEWEKAARGLFGRRWPWGNVWRDEMAAVTSRGESTVRPVAVADVSNVSPFGVRGTIGNVFEWTSSSEFAVPDITPLSSANHIQVRGGNWSSGFWNSQCASWQRRFPHHTKWVGFRCVREVR